MPTSLSPFYYLRHDLGFLFWSTVTICHITTSDQRTHFVEKKGEVIGIWPRDPPILSYTMSPRNFWIDNTTKGSFQGVSEVPSWR